MTFYREGKKFDYLEVIQTLDELVTKDILEQLEMQEISKLFGRFINFSKEVIEKFLVRQGYKVINIRQAFLTLRKLNIIKEYDIWDEAMELYEKVVNNLANKEEIVEFMSGSFSGAMKELHMGLEKRKESSLA